MSDSEFMQESPLEHEVPFINAIHERAETGNIQYVLNMCSIPLLQLT